MVDDERDSDPEITDMNCVGPGQTRSVTVELGVFHFQFLGLVFFFVSLRESRSFCSYVSSCCSLK